MIWRSRKKIADPGVPCGFPRTCARRERRQWLSLGPDTLECLALISLIFCRMRGRPPTFLAAIASRRIDCDGAIRQSPTLSSFRAELQTTRHAIRGRTPITSPNSSKAAAQTSADTNWRTENASTAFRKCRRQAAPRPAAVRKNRPMKMLGTPQFFTKTSPRGNISG